MWTRPNNNFTMWGRNIIPFMLSVLLWNCKFGFINSDLNVVLMQILTESSLYLLGTLSRKSLKLTLGSEAGPGEGRQRSIVQ